MAILETVENVDTLDDNAFRQHVAAVLTRELTLGGYLRFLRLYGPHEGNFTEERRQWQENLTVEEVLAGLSDRKEAI